MVARDGDEIAPGGLGFGEDAKGASGTDVARKRLAAWLRRKGKGIPHECQRCIGYVSA